MVHLEDKKRCGFEDLIATLASQHGYDIDVIKDECKILPLHIFPSDKSILCIY